MHDTEWEREYMAQLLARSGIGDGRAFRDLYQMSASRLLPYAMRIVGKRELAEDVLQESFMAIWRDAGRFDCRRAAPLTWMVTIVRNKAVDFLRASRVHWGPNGTAYEGPACEVSDPARGPVEFAEHEQCCRRIGIGMSRLNARQRQAIELAFFGGMTHCEVAEQMIIPLGSAKTYIRRGCESLRKHLDGMDKIGTY